MMCVKHLISLRHPIDKYFIYGKDVDNKLKAYIYDWSSARHVDLPDGTLDYICRKFQVKRSNLFNLCQKL